LTSAPAAVRVARRTLLLVLAAALQGCAEEVKMEMAKAEHTDHLEAATMSASGVGETGEVLAQVAAGNVPPDYPKYHATALKFWEDRGHPALDQYIPQSIPGKTKDWAPLWPPLRPTEQKEQLREFNGVWKPTLPSQMEPDERDTWRSQRRTGEPDGGQHEEASPNPADEDGQSTKSIVEEIEREVTHEAPEDDEDVAEERDEEAQEEREFDNAMSANREQPEISPMPREEAEAAPLMMDKRAMHIPEAEEAVSKVNAPIVQSQERMREARQDLTPETASAPHANVRASRTAKHHKGADARHPERKLDRKAKMKLRHAVQKAREGSDFDVLMDAMSAADQLHLQPDEAVTFDRAEQRLLELGLKRVEHAKEPEHLQRIPEAVDLLFDAARSRELEDAYVRKLAEVDGIDKAREAERDFGEAQVRKRTHAEAVIYGRGKVVPEDQEEQAAPEQARDSNEAREGTVAAHSVDASHHEEKSEEDAEEAEDFAALRKRVQAATDGSDMDDLIDAMSASGELHLRPEESDTFDFAEQRLLKLGLHRVESAKERDHLQRIPAAMDVLFDEARSQALEDAYVHKLAEVDGAAAAREAERKLETSKVRRRTYAEAVIYGLGKAPWEMEQEAAEEAEEEAEEVKLETLPIGAKANTNVPEAESPARAEEEIEDSELEPMGMPKRARPRQRTAKHNKGRSGRHPDRKENQEALVGLRKRVQSATRGSDMNALLGAMEVAHELAVDPAEALTFERAQQRLFQLASQRIASAKGHADLANIPAAISMIGDDRSEDLELRYRDKLTELSGSLVQVATQPHGRVAAHALRRAL